MKKSRRFVRGEKIKDKKERKRLRGKKRMNEKGGKKIKNEKGCGGKDERRKDVQLSDS
jgi:hypothetical protein